MRKARCDRFDDGKDEDDDDDVDEDANDGDGGEGVGELDAGDDDGHHLPYRHDDHKDHRVLYAVDRTDARETKIRLALDLYKHNMIEIELPFKNPFRHTTMLGYNPRKDPRDGSGRPGGFLYTWDGGNQLTNPVKYHDIGYRC